MFNLATKSNSLAFLDIGSDKIACMITKMSASNQIEVLGFCEVESSGVRAGNIVDLAAASRRISLVVGEAEKISGIKVKRVYVNLPSNNLISDICQGSIDVAGKEITTRELGQLLISALEKYKDQKVTVIHSFNYDYILDGKRGIITPLGMYGELLTGYIHAILIPSNILSNIHGCLIKANLEVEGYIAASYASALSCLTDDEMRLGTLFIEFGGGVTSFSVFSDGHIIFTDAIGVGGVNVTNDIAKALCMDFKTSERLKRLHGTVISDSKEIVEVEPLTENEEPCIVKIESLKEIIKARVEEMLELVMDKLEERDYIGMSSRLVITGGASSLCSLKELILHSYALKVRVAHQKMLKSDKFTEVYKPSSSCIVGMAVYISNIKKVRGGTNTKEQDGSIQGLWNKVKNSIF